MMHHEEFRKRMANIQELPREKRSAARLHLIDEMEGR